MIARFNIVIFCLLAVVLIQNTYAQEVKVVEKACKTDDECALPFGKCIHEKCMCPHCPPHHHHGPHNDMVCVSDGSVMHSDCHVRQRSCQTNTTLTVLHPGRCTANDTIMCDDESCAPYGFCTKEKDQNMCKCPKECPMIYHPVCSSDGIYFNSPCLLAAYSCDHSIQNDIATPDVCQNPVCNGEGCPPYARCIMDPISQNKSCECPHEFNCPRSHTPVCSTTKQTFSNACLMRAWACKNETNMEVEYDGPCKDTTPADVAKLVCPKNNFEECTCPTSCPDNDDAVCSVQGRTFKNMCQLRLANCKEDGNFTMSNHGACPHDIPHINCCAGEDEDYGHHCLKCPHGRCVMRGPHAVCECPRPRHDCPDREQVCSSVGTLMTPCDIEMVSCLSRRDVRILHGGPCIPGHTIRSTCKACPPFAQCTPEGPGHVSCQCPMNCGSEKEFVCTTTNMSFRNPCEMRRDSCMTMRIHTVKAC